LVPASPASERAAPASAPADLPVIGKREVATAEASKDPRPRPAPRPQRITHTAPQHVTHTVSHRNITGDPTAQLNRQELTRHRSDAETPDGILGFFKILFH
jgi:hypothetical protein